MRVYALPDASQTPRGAKRRRSVTPPPGSSPPGPSRVERDEDSSLPPSSPPAPFSDTDESMDERDAVRDVNDDADDDDGEDLFAEEFEEYVQCPPPPSAITLLSRVHQTACKT